MASNRPSALRPAALVSMLDSFVWLARGKIESDAVRVAKFGARDLIQRAEVRKRREFASTLKPRYRLDPSTAFHALGLERFARQAEVAALGREILASLPEPSTGKKKFHQSRLLPERADALDLMLSIALDEALLETAANYLGVVPVLGDLDFFCSRPTPAEAAFSSSQLYHCDDTSSSQLKLFIYADDVSTDNGPLEVIAADRSKQVRDLVGYRYGGARYRVSDAEMDSLVPKAEQVAFTGPAGSAWLVDTARCFHRGSRIRNTARTRMVAIIQYVPPNCTQLPLRIRSGAPYRRLIRTDMTPLARAVLGEPLAGGG